MSRILPDSYEIDVALQLTVEDDFRLFIKFDDPADPIVKPDVERPSIADSCYISRAEAFSVSWLQLRIRHEQELAEPAFAENRKLVESICYKHQNELNLKTTSMSRTILHIFVFMMTFVVLCLPDV